MEEYEKGLIAFFEEEVQSKNTPPLKISRGGKVNRGRIGENFFLAACIFGCLVLFLQPSIYDNPLRRAHLPIEKYEAFKDEFPRVIIEGFQYMKTKKGVNHD